MSRKDEDDFEVFPASFVWSVIAVLATFFLYMVFVQGPKINKIQAERQNTIDTFYVVHNCRPHDYVATKHNPIRTYKCDNGIFIAEDMK